MKKNKLNLLITLFFLSSIFPVLLISGCAKQEKTKIKIGIPLQSSSALIICAWKKGFFKKENLNAEIFTYPSGKRCLKEGLLAGKIDVGAVGDIPYVINSCSKNDNFKIICSICSAGSIQKIIAVKSKGIDKPIDLKGKVIGTQKGSQVHYFLSRFLAFNLIDEKDVKIRYFKAENLPSALVTGKIDAFSMREPYISQAVGMLGSNNVIFENENINTSYDLLITSNNYIENHKEIIFKVLKALAEGERFIKDNPDDAERIVSNVLGVGKEKFHSAWTKKKYSIFLSQNLLNSLEENAKWAGELNLTGNVNTNNNDDNFIKKIDFEPLERLNKDKITLLR